MLFDLFKKNYHSLNGKNGSNPQPFLNANLGIPKDLEDFLRQGKELEYDRYTCEAGEVRLRKLQELKAENIKISTKHVPRISEQDDPNKNKNGSYIIPAVSLVAECENYDPDFVLLWLPREQKYGALSGACVNELLVFPTATWSDIAGNPVKYINAQWKGDYSAAEDFNPWQKYPFE
ncbi:MAG: hypothetical protein WC788_05935 [Candidatus Paceibacterota bacterium]|jgi:hypothetical protein